MRVLDLCQGIDRYMSGIRWTYTEGVTHEMVLLKGADNVVRRILPVALDAAGLPEAGEQLRSLPALRDAEAVRQAVEMLGTVRSDDPRCSEVVADACFWCSAACEAAVRNAAKDFQVCVAAAIRALEAGLPGIRVH